CRPDAPRRCEGTLRGCLASEGRARLGAARRSGATGGHDGGRRSREDIGLGDLSPAACPLVLTFIRELLAYRALIQTLVSRDLKARYRGSSLGWLWTLLNPVMYVAIYTLIFSIFMRMQMDHYALFLLCGMTPWIWFSSSLNLGASSIVEGGGLLKKVYFPPQVL